MYLSTWTKRRNSVPTLEAKTQTCAGQRGVYRAQRVLSNRHFRNDKNDEVHFRGEPIWTPCGQAGPRAKLAAMK